MPEPPAQSEVFAEAGVRHADPVHEFWLLWRQGHRPDVRTYLQAGGQLNTLQIAAVLLVDQRERWLTGERLQAEYYLSLYPALLTDLEYCVELIYGEFLLREEVGEGPALAQYLERFPEYAPRLRQQFEFHRALEGTPSPKALDTMPTREAVSRPLEAPLSLQADSSWPSVTGYQILGPLGRGGMGVVYKALQRHAKRIVALKMVSATADAGPEALARFRTEIEAVARLQHPHIVHIYEVGEHDGRPYFSMEFADDCSLAQKLSGTPVPFRRAAQLVDTLARAINHAHEQGIIHRDLTPSNVLLMADGTPKISDFGLAKLVEAEAQSAADGAPHSGFRARTQTGAILGTPSYMPPEQASGRTRETGATGDVYALGAILYETLTGRPPFRAETPLETIRQVVSEEPVPPSRLQPGLPRDLVTVCLKCLEKEPRKRYISALALAEDLRRFLEGKPIQARRTGLLERGWRWCRRNPALASATGLAAAALVAVTAISVRFTLSQVRGKAELRAALHGSQRLAAELALDKGQLLGEQGDTNGALLWIAKSLNLAPADAHDFSAMARRNMAAWRGGIYPLRAILPHQGYAFSVAFTADGKTILTGSSDSTAHVWDAATGAQIRRQIGEPIPHPRGTMFSVAFSPDGKTMVSGGPDSTARLWDLVTGQLIWSRQLKETINTAAFSPQGKTVLIAWGSAYDERHGSAQLWDVATGEPLSPPLEHDRPVCAAAFSPDGNICVTESATWGDVRGRGLARFWDNHGHEVRRPLEHPHGVLRVCFTPDGTKLLTGTWDHTAKSWDLETGQQGLTLQHEAPVNGLAVSPDGKMVLTGSSDGTARLWDLSDGKPLGPPLRHPGLVACVAFSPDGKAILTGATDSAARLWGVAVNPPEGPVLRRKETLFPLAFSPDRRVVLIKDAGQTVRLRNTESGANLGKPLRHEWAVTTGAIGPDGKTIVTLGQKNATRIWNGVTGRPVADLQHPDKVWAIACSPDGKTIVTGDWAARARVWDAATGKLIRELQHPWDGPIFAIAFSPDSRTLATGAADRTARLWDVAAGKQIGGPLNHGSNVFALAFSPDGKALLTGGSDNTARLWDAATGMPLGPPLSHQGTVNAVAFSPDGRTIVTVSRDKTARLWDTATGKCLGPPLLHPGPVQHVAFWPDGTTLLTAREDGIARFWQLPTPVDGGPEQLELWSQVVTGMELEANGGVRVLDAGAWHERRARLNDCGFHSP